MSSPRQALKWPLMLGALGVSAWLALWGDKTPVDAASVVAPLPSAGRSAEAPLAADSPRMPRWAPRDAAATQAWAQSVTDPFRPLDAPAVAAPERASAPAAISAEPVLTVLGRGQLDDGRDTVFVRVADEVLSLHVGSQVKGLEVLAIEPQRLRLRRIKTHQTLSLPLSAPHGVFDQEKTPP